MRQTEENKVQVLSIGLVVYQLNSVVLEKTLASLNAEIQQLPSPVQLYLVDNFPSNKNTAQLKSLVDKFPLLQTKIIHVGKNIGYGASNNLAIFESKAQYHLVLNPDIFFHQGTLSIAINYMESHPDTGLLCPAIFGEEGERHYVHRKDPTIFDLFLRSFSSAKIKKWFAKRLDDFELRHLQWDKEQNIYSPSGCCMLFRATEIKKAQGFDPKFFLYYEDSDLGRRLRQFTQLTYLPEFKVTHLWAREAHKTLKMKWQMIKSGLRYLMKWGMR